MPGRSKVRRLESRTQRLMPAEGETHSGKRSIRRAFKGLFAEPRTFDVLVRMATAPGEYTDDSKLSAGDRGLAIEVLGVEGESFKAMKPRPRTSSSQLVTSLLVALKNFSGRASQPT